MPYLGVRDESMMQAETSYKGKKALVVGAGRSGLAAAGFLIARGARVTLTDSQKRSDFNTGTLSALQSLEKSGLLEAELGRHRPESFENCDFVVVSPGVPLSLAEFEISRRASIPVMAEIELAFRHLKGRIIGISGSNGKTTTTTLVAALLRGAGLKAFAAGNIGQPLTGFVSDSGPDHIYVVELSSFQLEGIVDFRPSIGSILNVTPDHMDRYEDFAHYAGAKRRMFANQNETDFAVLNADDAVTASMASGLKSAIALFSRVRAVPHGAFVHNGHIVFRDPAREIELFPVGSIPLPGSHNVENVLAAATMAILAGAPFECLEESVRNFKGVEHRIEFVAEIGGVRYFNDSKATNVEAAIKSVESFDGNILMIAGGRDKGSDFCLLRNALRGRVKLLVLIGEAAEAIGKALSNDVDTRSAGTLEEAVELCRRFAGNGDVVLLAPACASFDMFRNYEHRGQVFKETVRRLTE